MATRARGVADLAAASKARSPKNVKKCAARRQSIEGAAHDDARIAWQRLVKARHDQAQPPRLRDGGCKTMRARQNDGAVQHRFGDEAYVTELVSLAKSSHARGEPDDGD